PSRPALSRGHLRTTVKCCALRSTRDTRHSEILRVVALKQIAQCRHDGESVTVPWRIPPQITRLMVTARIDFCADHAEGNDNRLHRINSITCKRMVPFRPANFVPASPDARLLALWRINPDRNINCTAATT